MKFYKSEAPNIVSDFAKEFNFEDLRPYYDAESTSAMERIAHDELYHKVMAFMFPNLSKEDVIQKALNTKSPYEFQTGFMQHAIWSIIKQSAENLTWSGLEKLDKNKSYLYIANHRDILLDSAILQIILDNEEFETSEITFGSNLMMEGFVTDFCKMNRMFAIKREGTVKELYEISRQLSAYIRHTIVDKNVSIWISQRNGRTKDGNDFTQTGLLKMLNMSGNKDFKQSMLELNIVPITISYEYEPCDNLKVQELYLTNIDGEYIKTPGEDLNSILTGIKQQKGKIHVAFSSPIINELDLIDKATSENEKVKQLTACIDKQIHKNYKLNAVNYIAYDLLNQCSVFEKNYTENEKQQFSEYINSQTAQLTGEPEDLRNIIIKLYATPVANKLLKY